MSPELAATLAVAEWLLDAADHCLAHDERDAAFFATRLAATTLARQARVLMHPRIERTILTLAAGVPAARVSDGLPDDASSGTSAPRGCLHVLTQALPAGGHTAMATRWIASEATGDQHSVALLAQRTEVPPALQAAVDARKGRIHLAPDRAGPLEVAGWLRALAVRTASRVVFHVDVDDLVPAIAFGVPEGPPTIVVNHAAHIFWAGASVADCIANCRGSDLEVEWTRRYRGAGDRSRIVPIPLVDVDPPDDAAQVRLEARRRLGLPDTAPVLLSIGDTYKYAPFAHAGLDFLATVRELLERAPDAWFLVVGVAADARWAAAAEAVGGRLRVFGRQSDLKPFHLAADLYLEGFPFGSTTALLEAGLRGLAAVPAPAVSPPPFGTDGIAVDRVLARPATTADYVDTALRLLASPAEREESGRRLAAEIRRHHMGDGWNRHVADVLETLPREHRIYEPETPPSTPAAVHEYWTAFRETCWKGVASDVPTHRLIQESLVALTARGIRVRVPRGVRRAHAPLAGRRHGDAVPLSLLALATNVIRPWLPEARFRSMLYTLTTLFRPGSATSRTFSSLLPESLW